MTGLNWIEYVYWGFAILGGTLFILQTILLVSGANFGDDGLDAAGDHHSDGDASFKLLSMQGLTAFFMMFGLVGLALLKADLFPPLSAAGGMLAGLVSVWLIGLIFSQMKRLQSSGTIDIHSAINTEGTVYLTIPHGGTGQVQVITQGALKIFDAVSKDKVDIRTGEKIHVVDVKDGNTLIVKKSK